MITIHRPYAVALMLACLLSPGLDAQASTFTVRSTADSGQNTLRQAIADANSTSGADTIEFALTGGAPYFIALSTALPDIIDAVFIDGTSQQEYSGTPVVEIDGTATSASSGLAFGAGSTGSTLTGLAVVGFDSIGVTISATGVIIDRCYVGLEVDGTTAVANGTGIAISADSATVTGSTGTRDCLISGNTGVGITVASGVSGTVIKGVVIGLASDGFTDAGNGGTGIQISGASGTTVGGSGANDTCVISGNSGEGIYLSGSGATNNSIGGNRIGTNAAGTAAVANGSNGILLDDLSSATTVGGTTGNVLSGNQTAGIFLDNGASAVITGNQIGTDADGNEAVANSTNGIELDGAGAGTTIGGLVGPASNVISGNGDNGIYAVNGTGLVIQGNTIGLRSSGLVSLGNTNSGVVLNNVVNATVGGVGAANTISGNSLNGLVLTGTSCTGAQIIANQLGTSTAGGGGLGNIGAGVSIESGAHGNTLGPDNVVVDNGDGGVRISGAGSDDTEISDSLIGLLATTAAEGNTGPGISVEDADGTLLDGNRIGGNTGHGVELLSGSNTLLKGNRIGNDGSAARANGQSGVWITDATATTLGGNGAASEGNQISGNTTHGVLLEPGDGTIVRNNEIGVVLSGATALPNALRGIYLSSTVGATIGGVGANDDNTISGNTGEGVFVDGTASGNQLINNRIGTSSLGTVALPNGGGGVLLTDSASANTIGGSTAGQGNVISGNTSFGISFQGAAGSNLVLGNRIGTNADGDEPLPNTDGLSLASSGSNTVGGSGADDGNVISGNTDDGIEIAASSSNRILGNRIGTVPDGTSGLGNGGDGIELVGAATGNTIGGAVGEGNLISGNTSRGVALSGGATGTRISGNRIGTNLAGSAAVGNGTYGIQILSVGLNSVGGTGVGESNQISGNGGAGLYISGVGGDDNVVLGNRIGLDAAGSAALPNAGGVHLVTVGGTTIGGGTSAHRNVIAGNSGPGISTVGATNTLIQGNLIGIDSNGTSAVANAGGITLTATSTGTTIGGSLSGEGNQISGNTGNGITVDSTSGALVRGNLIGTNLAGTAAVGNSLAGIRLDDTSAQTIGGTGASEFNVISGNGASGIILTGADGSFILGNRIGTNSGGTAAVLNGEHGIAIDNGSSNTIGGTAAGAGNLLSGNGLAGIVLIGANATGNVLLGNRIGTNLAGTAAVGNTFTGVELNGAPSNTIGGGAAGAGNLISGNGDIGIFIDLTGGDDNVILGNTVGLNATDSAALPNAGGIGIFNVSGTTIGGIQAGEGNLIAGNAGAGLLLQTATSTVVVGNRVGVDRLGTTGFANSDGVSIDGGATNTLGGASAGTANVISGNSQFGIYIAAGTGHLIRGNFIGTAPDGSTAVPNTTGMHIVGTASATTIGGTGAGDGNVISGNTNDGVHINGSSVVGTLFQGNFIGTVAEGTAPLANGACGIKLTAGSATTIGGPGAGSTNVISGNGSIGVYVAGSNTLLDSNRIGTNLAGDAAIGNGGSGVMIHAGAAITTVGSSSGNLISGNVGHGVDVSAGSSTVIDRNTIGTNLAGSAALPNVQSGVAVSTASVTIGSAGVGNLISGNGADGVLLSAGAAGVVVVGNRIGTNGAGAAALPNQTNGVEISDALSNTIGSSSANGGNVIAGNTKYGVLIQGSSAASNRVLSNHIGLDTSGTAAVPNANGVGIIALASNNTIGGTGTGEGNTISGNGVRGVYVSGAGSGNLLYGNRIGAQATVDAPQANTTHGVQVDNTNGTTIGGIGSGEANAIAHNGDNGVLVTGTGDTAIRGNRILQNTGLAIDLGDDGITPNDSNDADTGPNGLLNYPAIFAASLDSGGTNLTIQGQSQPGMAIDLFLSDHTQTHGQGEVYLTTLTEGSGQDTDATTGSYSGNINGVPHGAENGQRFRFTIANSFGLLIGHQLTAVGTLGGASSEFTGNAPVTGAAEHITIDAVANGFAHQNLSTVTVSVRDSSEQVVATDSTTQVTLSLHDDPNSGDGGSSLSGTLTKTVIDGVATFTDLQLDRGGVAFRLLGTPTGGLTDAVSNFFDVLVSGIQWRFGTQPADGVVGTPLPAFTVQVTDSQGAVDIFDDSSDVTIAIADDPNGGSILGGTLTRTVTDGVATFDDVTVDRTGTGFTLSANGGERSAGISTAFDVASGSATKLVFGSQPQNGQAGEVLSPFTVKVLNASDALVTTDNSTQVSIAFASDPNSGAGGSSLNGTVTRTVAGGVATFDDLSINQLGVGFQFGANASGLTGATSDPFTIDVGPPTALNFATQPPGGRPGLAMASFGVEVTDSQGNRLVTDDTTPVTLSLATDPNGDTVLGGTLTRTVVQGLATFDDITLDKPGVDFELGAAATNLAPGTSRPFGLSPAKAVGLRFDVQPTNGVAGQTLSSVTVSVIDEGGAVVGADNSTQIDLSLHDDPAAGSTLGGTLSRTVSGGQAIFNDLTIDRTGTGFAYLAQAGALADDVSDPFDISPGSPAALVFLQQPSGGVAGQTLAPVSVEVRDDQGNRVTSSSMDIGLALQNPLDGNGVLSGTTTSAAIAGLATFGNLQIGRADQGYLLQASGGGLPGIVSDPFDITAAPATQLVFVQQPTTTAAGEIIAPPVTVQAQDANGNLDASASGSVTVAIGQSPSPGVPLSGILTQPLLNGQATFDDLSIGVAGADYTLTAAASGLTGDDSLPFSIGVGLVAAMRFVQPPPDGIAGTPLSPSPSVELIDGSGNRVNSSATILVGLVDNPSGATLGGTVAVAAQNGLATFDTLTVDRAGAGFTLGASSAGLSDALSELFDIVPGAAGGLRFVAQPPNGTAGAALNPGPSVEVIDGSGNRVDSSATITVALANNPAGATLSGTVAVAAQNGLATFDALTLDKSGTGFTLAASSASVSGASSDPFDIVPGGAVALRFVQQADDVVAGQTMAPEPSVEVIDAQGNRVLDSSALVTFKQQIFSPAAETVAGTAVGSVNAQQGLATLSGFQPTQAGRFQLNAESGDLSGALGAASFLVSPAAPAAELSSLSGSPLVLRADGVQAISFQLTVRDRFGNLCPNIEPGRLAIVATPADGVTITGPSTATDGNGRTTATATSAKPGAVQFGATVDGNPVPLPVDAEFRPRTVSAEHSTVTIEPARVAADGSSTALVTVTLHDQNDQPVIDSPPADRALAATVEGETSDQVTVVDPGTASDASGRFAMRVAAGASEVFALQITVDGTALAPVTLTGRLFYDLNLPEGLHLVALPFIPDPDSAAQLANKDGVQAAIYDPLRQLYLPLTPDIVLTPGFTAMAPGRGFWLRLADDLSQRLRGEPVPDGPVSVPLTQGWNLIGNPFGGSLNWNLANLTVTRDGTTLPLATESLWATVLAPYVWQWDSATNRYVLTFERSRPGFEGVADALAEGRGAFIRAFQDCTLTFTPPVASRASRAAEEVTARDWHIDLLAQAGEVSSSMMVGMTSRLTRALELETPPPAGESPLTLTVLAGQRSLAGEMRPFGRDAQEWELVATSAGSEPVTLRWPSLMRQMPRGLVVELTDLQTAQTTLLNTRASYVYTPSRAGEERRLRLTSRYGNVARTTITSMSATPTRGRGMELNLVLTGEARITLTVRGLGGKVVKQVSEEGGVGNVRVVWDGTDQQGRRVPAGTYVLEAVAESPNGAANRAVRTVNVR